MEAAIRTQTSTRRMVAIFLFLCPCLLSAQNYVLDWDTIAAGGGMSTAGPYALMDTLGQLDAGTATSEFLRWEAGFLPGLNGQPTANPSSWTSTEDTTLLGTLAGSDPDGDVLTFTLDTPPAHGIVMLSADGTFHYAPATNWNGADMFTFKVSDGEFDSPAATVGLALNPANDAPTVTCLPASQSVQYSDPIHGVVVSAADVDSAGSTLTAATAWQKDGGPITQGLPAGLTLLEATTTADSKTWMLLGTAQATPGTYLIRVSVTDDQAATGSADLTLVVTPEDAHPTYTGALFVSTASPSSGAATVTLSATVQDITAVPEDPAYDASPGDVRQATVTFVNRDNNTVIAADLPVDLVKAGDLKTGAATYNWRVDIGTANSQSFTIGILVNRAYARDTSADDTVVTVSRPLASDFVTGGGYLILSRSTGLHAGDPGSKANFGLNAKYNKSGNNLQGGIRVLVRSAGRVYQVKGNAMTSLSIAQNRGTFNGKVSIQDVTDPLAPLEIDGNATLQAKMTDNGEPGAADTLAITVWSKTGGIWFASDWDGRQTVEKTLAGGNLLVRSGKPLSIATAEVPAGRAEMLLTITPLPDPFAHASAPRPFLIRFPVVPETDYALEHSADLVTWTHLTTVMSLTSEMVYIDAPIPAEPNQFYRIRGPTPGWQP